MDQEAYLSGFIAMSRDALDHPVLRDAERFRAWFWLVANASWKPNRARIKGESIDLNRGELSFSQRFLAEKWGWSKSRVDRFIADLRAEGMIETRSKIGATTDHAAGQGQSIISICNYDKYQTPENDQRGNAEPVNGATAGQQRGKEEQGNNNIGGEGSAGARDAKPKTTKAKRVPVDEVPMPADWQPILTPAAQRIVDGWPPGMFDRELMAFEGHARSNDRMTKDWQAAFRTWIAKAEERRTASNGNSRNNAGPYPARNGGRPKDGAIAACDRRLGLDGSFGEQPRHDDRAGSGDRGRTLAPARILL